MSQSIDKMYKVMLKEVNLEDVPNILKQLDETKINELANGGVCGGGCAGDEGKVCGLGCDGKAIDVIDPKGTSELTRKDLEAVKNQLPKLRQHLLEHMGSVILEYQSDLNQIDVFKDFDFHRDPRDINGHGRIEL